jgi:predicted nuclease of predicted toxin-antitoxin system
VRFLIDTCAGRRLAEWLRSEGHDVEEVAGHGADPGDPAILARAAAERRILVTMDKDFGLLIFVDEHAHAGLVRLPHVRWEARIALMRRLLDEHAADLAEGCVLTVKGSRVRISRHS